MKKTLIPLGLRSLAAFAIAGALSLPAQADTPITNLSKPAAPGCVGKTFMDPGQNPNSGHAYLFMMVFKAGTGGKYFGNTNGNPGYATTGCIGVIDGALARKAKPGAKVVGDPGDVYPADICPTDCTEPDDGGGGGMAARAKKGAKAKAVAGPVPLDRGSDPLGVYNWGVLSALSASEGDINTPVAGNTFEVWQVKVRDACQARDLYNFYSAKGQFLAEALAAGDLMGQMMTGYRVQPGGKTEACK